MSKLLKILSDALGRPYAIWVIVGLGLALRLAFLIPLSRFPLVSDARAYHEMALQLLQNKDFVPYWPAGLPYYLCFFYKIFGASELAARVSMLLIYPVFSALLYLFAREFSSQKAACLAVLIFSFYPGYVHLSLEPITHLPLATYLLALACLAALLLRKSSWPAALATGVLLGTSALIRPSAIALSMFLPLYLWVKTKSVRASLVPLMVSLIILSGWLFRTYRLTGQPITVSYANWLFFLGNNPYTPLYKTWWFGSHGAGEPDVPEGFVRTVEETKKNPPAVQDRLWRRIAVNHILSRPDLFLLRTFNRVRNYFAFDTFTGSYFIKDYKVNKKFGLFLLGLDAAFFCGIMLLAFLFVFHSGRSFLKKDGALLLLGMAAAYAGPYWLSYSHPTYHFPTIPLFGILASAMAVRFMEQPAETWHEILSSALKKKYLLALFLLIFVYIQLEWIWVMWERL